MKTSLRICVIALSGMLIGCRSHPVSPATAQPARSVRPQLAAVPIGPNPDAKISTLRLTPFRGENYYFQISSAALYSSPVWSKDAPFPPLSPRQAEQAALKEANRLFPDIKSWWRERISLEPFTSFKDTGRWYYVVTLSPADEAVTGLPFFLDFPVLMNGQAVPGTSDPQQ